MGAPLDTTVTTDWDSLPSTIDSLKRLATGESELSIRAGDKRGVVRTAHDGIYTMVVEDGPEPLETCVRDGRSGWRAYVIREQFQRAADELIERAMDGLIERTIDELIGCVWPTN